MLKDENTITTTRTQEQIKGTFANARKDRWWASPSAGGIYLILLIIYITVVLFFGFQENQIRVADTHYLSPIFASEIPAEWVPAFWPVAALTPALLILWAPAGFRATCYYCRRVYYRSFFASPPACSVDGVSIMQGRYKGEKAVAPVPFILNNYHRYFLYVAIILAIFHWFDTWEAMHFVVGIDTRLGIGIGTLLIAIDALFLTLYVLFCHSFRHLIGGGSNTSNSASNVTDWLNKNHAYFFWISITTIVLADMYIRLLANGMVPDFIFFFPLI